MVGGTAHTHTSHTPLSYIIYIYKYIIIFLITAEKATEILKEVRGAQEAFKKQMDLCKLETEVCSKNAPQLLYTICTVAGTVYYDIVMWL